MFNIGTLAYIVVFAFGLIFVGQTLNRSPRDLLVLKEFYLERNWTEFYVHLAVTGFFWLGSLILVYFFLWPVARLMLRGLGMLVGVVPIGS